MITTNGGAALIPNGTNQQKEVTSSTPVKFDAFPPGTLAVRLNVKIASVNIRTDDTAPSTTVGEELEAGTHETWPIEWFDTVSFIAVSTTANIVGIPLKYKNG